MYKIIYRTCIVAILIGSAYGCKSSSKSISSNTKKSSLKSTKSNPAIDKTIRTAKSYHGTKYKYGGNSKSGIDCSGLMCRAYESVDIHLPRTSSAQSTSGKRIYIGEVREGDLLFFATGKSKTKITHVGLVIEVSKEKDIKFIHATTKRGVCEDWLSQPYYKDRYIKAIRVFN